jgi:endonuclease YncB( thermonuclease family)
MEFVSAIILLALFFIVYGQVAGKAKRREREATQLRTEDASVNKGRPVWPTQATVAPPSQPAPFEDESSHPLPVPEVIEGPAYIVDGDTIRVQKTQIRLYGVDAPEMNHPFGKKAKWELVKLCKGQRVRAEITAMDDHGRTVAKCFLPDGRDLSAEMVKAGLAIDWPKFSDGAYAHLEVDGVRKKLWLADARQKGWMHVWEKYEAGQRAKAEAAEG